MPSQKARKKRQQQQRAQYQQHPQAVIQEESLPNPSPSPSLAAAVVETATKTSNGPRNQRQTSKSSEVTDTGQGQEGAKKPDTPETVEQPVKQPPTPDLTQSKTETVVVNKRSKEKAVVMAGKEGDNKAGKEAVKKTDKTKAEILAEREAKKAEKAARRAGKQKKPEEGQPEGAKEAPENFQKENDPPQAEEKSKAQLKAERRAKQEAQREAKIKAKAEEEAKKGGGQGKGQQQQQGQGQTQQLAKQTSKTGGGSGGTQRVPDDIQADRVSVEKKLQRKLANAQIPARTKAQRKVMLFSHLHQYERELSIGRRLPVVGGTIHPAIVEIGLKYAEGTVCGSNARCVALLAALKKVIQDYVTPPQKELSRDLDAKLKPYITFLKQCRPLSVSMGNSIRFLKARINGLSADMPDAESKELLCESVDNFVHENIVLAARQIAITANTKIKDGDVILTYGCSSLIKAVLTEALRLGRRFRVVVADGRPRCEGREMARALVVAAQDSSCSVDYVQVSSLPYIMPEVTKAFLGAHAVLANGSVMSRVGTSQVALIAKAFHVPVLVCCETYKFSERVQTDSFVFNELGDPDDLVALRPDSSNDNIKQKPPPLTDWRDMSALCLLNLTYDVTPASLVDAIISEISVIPTTSVPVVLRLKNVDNAAIAH